MSKMQWFRVVKVTQSVEIAPFDTAHTSYY